MGPRQRHNSHVNNLLDIFQYFINKGTNSPIMNKMCRLCLYNKARQILLVEVFTKIYGVICKQQTQFQKKNSEYFSQAYVFTNDLNEIFINLDHK